MILDAENIFSLRQSLVNGTGNLLSTKSIDTGAAGTLAGGYNARGSAPHDPGKGTPVEVECQINTSVDSAGGAATIEFQLVMADNEELTSNLTVLARTAALAEATLVKEFRPYIAGVIPPGVTKRWLGVRYVIAGEAVTVGTVTACLTFPGGKQTA
jgi:hypothetical protein